MDFESAEDRYYHYEPLSKDQIRVLIVHPSTSDQNWDPVQISIQVVDLNSNPKYNTLSYTWGPPIPHLVTEDEVFVQEPRCYPIMCQNKILRGTLNLLHALWRIQYLVSARDEFMKTSGVDMALPIWIDALCINQDDRNERNQQVPLMGKIYASCQATFAYLGPDDGYVKPAMNLMIRIGRLIQGQQQDQLASDAFPDRAWKMFKSFAETVQDEDWLSLSIFSRRLWFQRSWVMQEVVLSPLIVLSSASLTFPFAVYEGFMLYILLINWFFSFESLLDSLLENPVYTRPDLMVYHSTRAPLMRTSTNLIISGQTVDRAGQMIVTRQHREKGLPINFLDAYNLSFRTMCQNPRDKVFAFFALFREFVDAPRELMPDYGLPVDEIYIRTCVYLMQWHNSFELLATTYQGHHFAKASDLPSWCPDLRLPTPYSLPFSPRVKGQAKPVSGAKSKKVLNCSAGLKFQLQRDDSDSRCIQVAGLHFSTVIEQFQPRTCFDLHSPLECTHIIEFLERTVDTHKASCHESKIDSIQSKTKLQPANAVKQFWEAVLGIHDADSEVIDTRVHSIYHILKWLLGEMPKTKFDMKKPSGGKFDKSSLKSNLIVDKTAWDHQVAAQLRADLLFKDESYSLTDTAKIAKLINSKANGSQDSNYKLESDDILCILKAYVEELLPLAGSRVDHDPFNNEKFRELYQVFSRQIEGWLQVRTLLSTNDGFIGVGSPLAKCGDQVWILAGASMPHILRPKAYGRYEYLGPCYVHGIMHGEAVTPDTPLTEILIE